MQTLLSLSSSSAITLSPSDYLAILRSLTRRQLTCKRHLPEYLHMASSIPSSSSPYHPFHHDQAIMSSLPSSSLPSLRRALFFLTWAMRVDMAVQALRKGVGQQRMQLAQRIAAHAGCLYMESRLSKALQQQLAEAELSHIENLSPDLRTRFPSLLASASTMRRMSADDARRLSAELEALTSPDLTDTSLQQLLLASLHSCDDVSSDEVDTLRPLLPLVARKLEVNADPERDRVMRWRVMELVSDIQSRMRADGTGLTPILIDEVLRVYANCAAIEPALTLFNRISHPDLLSFQYLFRCVSLLQRWEKPHVHAMELLARMRASGHQVIVPIYNDVLRALDKGERFDLIRQVVEEMKAEGLEGNDVTWQYVGQAAASAGEEEAVREWMGKEGLEEVKADLQAVDEMTMEDFFPEISGDEGRGGEIGGDELMKAAVVELKAKMKAELSIGTDPGSKE